MEASDAHNDDLPLSETTLATSGPENRQDVHVVAFITNKVVAVAEVAAPAPAPAASNRYSKVKAAGDHRSRFPQGT